MLQGRGCDVSSDGVERGMRGREGRGRCGGRRSQRGNGEGGGCGLLRSSFGVGLGLGMGMLDEEGGVGERCWEGRWHFLRRFRDKSVPLVTTGAVKFVYIRSRETSWGRDNKIGSEHAIRLLVHGTVARFAHI